MRDRSLLYIKNVDTLFFEGKYLPPYSQISSLDNLVSNITMLYYLATQKSSLNISTKAHEQPSSHPLHSTSVPFATLLVHSTPALALSTSVLRHATYAFSHLLSSSLFLSPLSHSLSRHSSRSLLHYRLFSRPFSLLLSAPSLFFFGGGLSLVGRVVIGARSCVLGFRWRVAPRHRHRRGLSRVLL